MFTTYVLGQFKHLFCNVAYGLMLSIPVLLPVEQVSFAATLPQKSVGSDTSMPLLSTPTSITSTSTTKQTTALHPTHSSQVNPFSHTHASNTLPHRSVAIAQSKSSGVSSNALAFQGSSSYSVDSRTGQLSTGAVVASGLFAEGTQKRNLIVSYSSTPHTNRFGLGKNWSFNLGSSDHATHTKVVLSNGKSFRMIKNEKGEWVAQYHKLNDVNITGSPETGWTFYLLNGVIEHINQRGDEAWEEDALGHQLTFTYDQTGQYDHLTGMCDADQHCITLTYGANRILVSSLFPNEQREQTQITLSRIDDQDTLEVVAITLPGKHPLTTRYHYTSDMNYGAWGTQSYLNKITGPAGGKVSFIWNDSNHQTHQNGSGLAVSSAQGTENAYMPVVTEQMVDPGNHEPPMHLFYRYGTFQSAHNFTGFGLVNVDYVPHQDPLLHNNAASDYTYVTSTDNGQVNVSTLYNRFHLPIERSEWNDTDQTLITTTHFRYPLKLSASFEDQTPTYSLPVEKATTVYSSAGNTSTPITKTVYMRYNNEGLITFKQDPYGRQVYTTYCPAKGNQDCPTLGADLPFSTVPYQVLTVPALL